MTIKDPQKKEIELTITDVAVGGKGISRENGKVIFVEKGLPGQRVLVQLYKIKKDYSEGRVIEVLKNSPLYCEPKCSHFSYCGGCSFQNMNYEEQIQYKRQWVVDSLCRIGGFDTISVDETLPAPEPFFYRNKMEFSFSNKTWDPVTKKINNDTFGLGLHLPGRYDTVITIDECFLQSNASNRIVHVVREMTEKSGLPAYNIQTHKGFWRFLIIREGKSTGEMLINLITNECSEEERSFVDSAVKKLSKKLPEVSGFFHSEHSGKSQAASWQSIRKIYGADHIEDKIGNSTYRIDCETFFQTNTCQTKNLYEVVREAGKFGGHEILFDLFSGIGTIPVFLSGFARKIVGFEINEKSVEAARTNAERNGAENCRFVQGKVRSLLKQTDKLIRKFGQPDVIVANPPRNGMDRKTLERIIKLNAHRIVYVSCNPATLARDAKILGERYDIEKVTPVDMFPQTAHIETVMSMVKNDKK